MLKEVCPQIVSNIVKPIEFPTNEQGQFFADYFRWNMISPDHVQESVFGYLFHWLDEVSAITNTVRYGYQSTDADLEQYYRTAFALIRDNAAGSVLSAHTCLFKLLITMDLNDRADDFLQIFLPMLDNRFPPECWAQTLALLLMTQKEQEAKAVLDKYLALYPLEKIKNSLSVADFAHRCGIKGFELESSVFRQIMANTRDRVIEKNITGKSVALVGNGPQETGKKQGGKIDDYDLVIRMNAYNLTDEYSRDYGSKCDIWYRTAGEYPNERQIRKKGNPLFSIVGTSPYGFDYPPFLVRQFADELEKGHIIQSVSTNDFKNVLKKTNIWSPSGGALMSMWIKTIKPDFKLSDCFGLALSKNETPSGNWKRADGTVNPLPYHNMFYEWAQIHKLFEGNKI